MPTTIHSTFKGVTETRLLRFDRAHGLHLSEDYREFLMEFNGGVPDPKTFHVPALKEDNLVDILFGIDLEKDFELETWLLEYRDEIPEGFLIIGADPGGNLLLLADGQARNGVFYWDHTLFFKPSNEQQNTYRVAASFTQFLFDLK